MLKCFIKGHSYVHLTDKRIFENYWDRGPIKTFRLYQCTRCMKIKKVCL